MSSRESLHPDTLRFFAALFAPEDYILLRPIESWTEGDQKRTSTKSPAYPRGPVLLKTRLERLFSISASKHLNIFFGVCPRVGGNKKEEYDLAWQIRTVRTLWADVDRTTPAAALARIDEADLPQPSLVVNSGNGVHFYWLLDEPYLIDDVGPPDPVRIEWPAGEPIAGQKKRPLRYLIDKAGQRVDVGPKFRPPRLSPKALAIQDILHGLAVKIGGDHTNDLTRLLRVPGTMNRKDERNGRAPVPCELVSCEPDRRYPLSEFEDLAKLSPDLKKRKHLAAVPLKPASTKISGKRQERLERLIFACGIADIGERSERDFDLCAYALRTGIAKPIVWGLAESAGKFSEGGERYFETTWAAAEEEVRGQIYDEMQKKKAHVVGAKPSPNGKHDPAAWAEHVAANTANDDQKIIEADDDPHRLARLYLKREGVIFWRNGWWKMNANCFWQMEDKELKAVLTRLVKEEFDRINIEKQQADGGEDGPPKVQKINRNMMGNVVGALEGIAVVSEK